MKHNWGLGHMQQRLGMATMNMNNLGTTCSVDSLLGPVDNIRLDFTFRMGFLLISLTLEVCVYI